MSFDESAIDMGVSVDVYDNYELELGQTPPQNPGLQINIPRGDDDPTPSPDDESDCPTPPLEMPSFINYEAEIEDELPENTPPPQTRTPSNMSPYTTPHRMTPRRLF